MKAREQAPFPQRTKVGPPEHLTFIKILKNHVPPAALDEFLGQGHVRAEGVQLGRTWRFASQKQLLAGTLDVAVNQGKTAKDHVPIVNRVAVVPILLELRCQLQGLARIGTREVIIPALEGRHLGVGEGEESIVGVLALG